MACDICGKKVARLENLSAGYRTPDIQQACPECIAVLNEHLSKLRKTTRNLSQTWIKAFMQNMREKFK